jgi:hypothetical protein
MLTDYLKKRRGQGTVEFALALPLFVLVFFAIVEFAHLFYVRLTLQQAIRQAGRYMVTGRADVPNPDDPKKKLPRKESIEAVFNSFLIGTGAGLRDFSMTCGGVDCDGGAPGATVTLSATFAKPFFTVLLADLLPDIGCGTGKICFTFTMTWVNEPFVS